MIGFHIVVRAHGFGKEHSNAFAMRDYFNRGGRCAERLLDILDAAQYPQSWFCAIYGDFKHDFLDVAMPVGSWSTSLVA